MAAATLFLMVSPSYADIWEFKSPSLHEIQAGYDSGKKYQRYAGVAGKNSANSYPYVFANDLKPGTVLPKVVDAHRLLRAAKKKQVVKVTNLDNKWYLCFPVLQEIAYQNQISCEGLILHLNENWEDDKSNPIGKAQERAEEIAEAIEEELMKETDEVIEMIEEEVIEVIEEEVIEVIEEEIIEEIETWTLEEAIQHYIESEFGDYDNLDEALEESGYGSWDEAFELDSEHGHYTGPQPGDTKE